MPVAESRRQLRLMNNPNRTEDKTGEAPSVLMENLFVAWWIATVASCAYLLVSLPGWLEPVAGRHRFSAMAVVVAAWLLMLYGVGNWLNRRTAGRFAQGYPPFAAAGWRVVAFIVLATGVVLVPLAIFN